MCDVLDFLDDSSLFDNAAAMIGFILLGAEEVPTIDALRTAIDTAEQKPLVAGPVE